MLPPPTPTHSSGSLPTCWSHRTSLLAALVILTSPGSTTEISLGPVVQPTLLYLLCLCLRQSHQEVTASVKVTPGISGLGGLVRYHCIVSEAQLPTQPGKDSRTSSQPRMLSPLSFSLSNPLDTRGLQAASFKYRLEIFK